MRTENSSTLQEIWSGKKKKRNQDSGRGRPNQVYLLRARRPQKGPVSGTRREKV